MSSPSQACSQWEEKHSVGDNRTESLGWGWMGTPVLKAREWLDAVGLEGFEAEIGKKESSIPS